MYCIYKIQNCITDQVYIGMSGDINMRFYQHCQSPQNSLLKASIKEYGISNFTFCVLQKTYNRDEAKKLENFFTIHYNSLRPNGFNFCLNGGKQCNIDWSHTVDLRKALRPKRVKIPYLISKTSIPEDRFKKLLNRRENFTKEEIKLINKTLGTKLKLKPKTVSLV